MSPKIRWLVQGRNPPARLDYPSVKGWRRLFCVAQSCTCLRNFFIGCDADSMTQRFLRLVRDQAVDGSNPFAPTNLIMLYAVFSARVSFKVCGPVVAEISHTVRVSARQTGV
jgi:hypothetical protein